MPGLINEQMQEGAPPEEQMQPMQQPQQMQQGQQMPMDNEAEESGPGEDDPTFQAAVEFANEALYSNQAAKDVSKQLKAAPSLVDGMANVAYEITSVVDERTNGEVPDELLVPLAMKILEEVVEIADASGLDPQPEDVALAFKQMILRYLQEQGADTAQLDEAMNQVDPSVFRQAAEENTEEV